MSEAHLSAGQLDRLSRRNLGPDEILTLARHMERCAACAARAREYAANDLTHLRRALTTPPARSGRAWKLALAAAAAAIVGAAALWMLLPSEVPSAPSTVRVMKPRRSPPATVTQAPAGYATPEWNDLVAAAKAAGTLPFPPDLAELRGAADVVRGAPGESAKVHPAGIVLEDTRPKFTWNARRAGTYTVYVFDGEREIARSAELRAAAWRPERELPRGRTLSWQVEVMDGDRIETIPRPPAPPAKFRIVSDRDLREIERARALHPHDHLLHAVLYARAGMRDEALAAAKKDRP